jgi:putative transposase
MPKDKEDQSTDKPRRTISAPAQEHPLDAGRGKRSKPLTSIPDEVWQKACQWEEVLRPLAAMKQLSRALIADACETLQICRTQFYKALRHYRADPRAVVLVPLRRGAPTGTNRLAPEVQAIVEHSINTFYLTRQKPSVAALHRHIEQECRKAELQPPDKRTVEKRVANLPPFQVLRAREGAPAARQKFAPLRGRLETAYPLDVVQIDHTKIDIIIVDEVTRQSIGRPWLTLVLDVDSRMVCGFWISPDPPSTTSVALAVANAVLPKAAWLEASGLGVDLPWPVAGLPRCLHVDNAREFHSKAFVRACQQYGIVVRYRPAGRPHYGGHIERLLGTLMRLIHELPGTTFSSIQERGDADPEAGAVLTLRELERVFALYVLGPYHHAVHSALGIPPLAAWAERLGQRPFPPAQPQDPDEFLYSFLPFKEVTIRREGLRLHSIFYYDDVLTTWLGHTTRRVRVKYNPRNLSCVYLEDPEGRHWPIRYSNLGRPAITLWEQKAAVKALRERGSRLVNEQAIFASVEARRAIIADAAVRTKAARRSQQRVSHLTALDAIGSDKAACLPLPSTFDDAHVPMPDNADLHDGKQPS